MPCKQSKARKLLKQNKAKIINYKPFTIQLLYGCSGYKQPIEIGIDSGSKYIGIAITSEDKVLSKGIIQLRTDVKELLITRRILRRSRRNRKTRYRRCKFKYKTTRKYNPKKKKWVKHKFSFKSNRIEEWLPPSIQSRIDNQILWINKFIKLVPNPKVIIELGKFDVQKIINPNITGEQYQQGKSYGFYNFRYYVFARDNYKCQICKGKSKDDILQTHHIIQRKDGGSDRAENLATVCMTCHSDFHAGKINYKFKKPKQYKETTFMNILRRKILKRLDCDVTYGNITTSNRKALELDKTHYNDAIAISGIVNIKDNSNVIFYIKQFRKKKRSLHESTARKGRKTKNTISKRNEKNTKFSKGFYLNDKVKVFKKVGFISGFCKGGVYIKDIEGNYITMSGKNYKQVSFKNIEVINHNNNWQFIQSISA